MPKLDPTRLNMTMSQFQLSLLGPFELSGPQGAIDLAGRKMVCLLGFLAATLPAAHSRDKLTTLLWGSHLDAQARQSLRQSLHRLRSILGPDAIVTNGEMVSLRANTVVCDAVIFEALARDGSPKALRKAVALYRGRLLDDCSAPEEAWHEWLDVEARRLEAMALDAMVKLGELELQMNRAEEALSSANRALEISNLREDAHRLVMRALSASGRRAEALKHCEHLKTVLKAELNVPPDATTLRLETELRSTASAAFTSNASLTDERSAPSLPDRPSIAVLPFANMSGNPTQDYIADGIVEDIITELSRYGELFVIARNSSFQYKGSSTDVRLVGRELGVRYVLEGSVRVSGKRVRIAAQLIDAQSGYHLWAEKFDYAFGDILSLQDAVTQSVVGAIQPQILFGEGRRAARKSPVNLDAFDCCMRGNWHFHQDGADRNKQAEGWLRRSIELDPTSASAYVVLSRIYIGRCWAGYSDDIDRDLGASQAAVDRALVLNDRDPACHYALSVLSLLRRRHEHALAAAEEAIRLNANFALGYFALGESRVFLGNFAEALDPLTRCLRLNPLDPFSATFIGLVALAHYHLGNYSEAIAHAERALQTRRNLFVLQIMAATVGQLGRTEEARPLLAEMARQRPHNFRRHWQLINPYANPIHEAHLVDGLRKAGVPEH